MKTYSIYRSIFGKKSIEDLNNSVFIEAIRNRVEQRPAFPQSIQYDRKTGLVQTKEETGETQHGIRNRKYSLRGSFKFAFEGVVYVFKTQTNLRIHVLSGVAVILGGVFLGVTNIEMAILVLTIMFVIVSEVVNTALEVSLDIINGSKFHPLIKIAKDVVAASVLLASLNAVIIGIIILGKYIFI